MGVSPVPVLCIIALYTAVYMVLDPAQAMPSGAEDLNNPDNADLGDDAPGLLDVLGTVWGFVLLVGGALVFNVPGAPVYVQAPVAIMIIGSIAWSIVTLIRGN